MSEVLPLDEPDGYQTQATSPGGGFARIASPTDWVAFTMGSRQGALAKDRVTDLFRPPDDCSFEGRGLEIAPRSPSSGWTAGGSPVLCLE